MSSRLMQAAADVAATDHPYPLIRGGGLFLIGIGAGFLFGWIFPKRWIPLAVAGAIVGFTASGLSALLPSLGSPSVVQIGMRRRRAGCITMGTVMRDVGRPEPERATQRPSVPSSVDP